MYKLLCILGVLVSSTSFAATVTNLESSSIHESATLHLLPAKYDGSQVIPSGSYVKAQTLTGVKLDINDTSVPVLLQITGTVMLPNSYGVNLAGCKIVGTARADIPSNRILVRTEKLSCYKNAGSYEVAVKGWIVGEDGKAGVYTQIVNGKTQFMDLTAGRTITIVFSNSFKI